MNDTPMGKPIIPDGFRELPGWGFTAANGPLYGKREADGGIVLAFAAEQRHCNPMKIVHGGMLFTLADMVVVFTSCLAIGGEKMGPTISMSCDFLAAAPMGSFVEGRGRALRTTRNMVFSECLLTIGGAPVLRASGIMKVPSENSHKRSIAHLFDAPAGEF
jgi:uncharacterized protein (TIGR00369 family)